MHFFDLRLFCLYPKSRNELYIILARKWIYRNNSVGGIFYLQNRINIID